MKNKNIFLIVALALVMTASLFAGCTNEAETAEQTSTEEMTEETTEEMTEDTAEELVLTLDELKMYDGTNGNPAYIAYDGVIYDVTDNSNWASGSHGGNMAGTDITEKLNSAPHGTSKLSQLEAVGKIAE